MFLMIGNGECVSGSRSVGLFIALNWIVAAGAQMPPSSSEKSRGRRDRPAHR